MLLYHREDKANERISRIDRSIHIAVGRCNCLGVDKVKGYYTFEGYVGWIPTEKRWMLFATETDYIEYLLVETNF